MKKVLFFLFTLLLMIGCSNVNEEAKNTNPADKFPPYSIEHRFLVEMGLKPSQIDNINKIRGFNEIGKYLYLSGQRNHKAWFSKLDKQGNEIYSCEFAPQNNYKYSYISAPSFLAIDDNVVVAHIKLTDAENDDIFFYGEYVSVIDNNTGEITKASILNRSMPEETRLYGVSSNGRHLIKRVGTFEHDNDYFCVIGGKNKVLYEGRWDKNRESLFRYGIVFITDNIVSQFYAKGEDIRGGSLKIVDFKNWKLIKTLDSSNGFIPKGDNFEKENVSYKVDTTFMQENKLVFVYDEYIYKEDKDEVSGSTTSSYNFTGKYFYEIDSEAFEPEYKGKYQN